MIHTVATLKVIYFLGKANQRQTNNFSIIQLFAKILDALNFMVSVGLD